MPSAIFQTVSEGQFSEVRVPLEMPKLVAPRNPSTAREPSMCTFRTIFGARYGYRAVGAKGKAGILPAGLAAWALSPLRG
jgi:hypothetical protein